MENQPLPGAGLTASTAAEAATPGRHNKQQCRNQPPVSSPLWAGRGRVRAVRAGAVRSAARSEGGRMRGSRAHHGGTGVGGGRRGGGRAALLRSGLRGAGRARGGECGPGRGGAVRCGAVLGCAARSRLTPLCVRLRLLWRRRRGATGPRRTTSATCRHTTAAPSR